MSDADDFHLDVENLTDLVCDAAEAENVEQLIEAAKITAKELEWLTIDDMEQLISGLVEMVDDQSMACYLQAVLVSASYEDKNNLLMAIVQLLRPVGFDGTDAGAGFDDSDDYPQIDPS